MSESPEHRDLNIGTRLRGSENTEREQQQARRAVALASVGVYDRARLLEMLGLVPAGTRLTVGVP